MAIGEFSLIDRFFSKASWPAGITVGVGDDAAVLSLPADHRLVACKDVLVQGRHFFPDVSAYSLGHKALAVNLSDLAAMGAKPIGCLLGIGLPAVDEAWLGSFVEGFDALATRYQCPLIGGDTVGSDQGIFISVTAFGALPNAQTGLLRSAAELNDDIWVSGVLGAPDTALRIMLGEVPDPEQLLGRLRATLESPQPRVELGRRLLGVAHAAVDISDGLTQDLGHILKASELGALIELSALPVHPQLTCFDEAIREAAVLHGGDVYELCFTAPSLVRQTIEAIGRELDIPLTRIGATQTKPGLIGRHVDGRCTELMSLGFDHFRSCRS